MKRRPFGRTGVEVSELVFGGGAVGGLLIDQDRETKHRALERALSAGINWIDTAPSYGQGRSEAALGELLPTLPHDPHLSTKFTVDTRDLSDVAGQIERSLEQSLRRLRRDSVTLLQLHNWIGAETAGHVLGVDRILERGGVLDVLEGLRGQGVILHFGITALGETAAIRRVIESGRIASAQVYFNLLNPSAAFAVPGAWPVFDFHPLLQACHDHGVAAMNIRVFSAGVIATDERTGRERPLTPGDTVESETEKAHTVFGALGDRYGTRAQAAVRFALAEPRLACVIFGLAELDHLEQALAAQEKGPLPDEALAELRGLYERGARR
jgi:L-galactose dehydrogenase/L-glyceraldehyde 3-phosphate reductase